MTLIGEWQKSRLQLLFIMVLCLLLLGSANNTLPEIALAKAKTYKGITEKTNNGSSVIVSFIRQGGGKPGWSWCMYYVCFCTNYASTILKVKCPLLKTGAVCRQLQYCYNSSQVKVFFVDDYTNLKVLPGDIIIMKNGYGFNEKIDLKHDWKGHTGYVVIQKDRTTLWTIEGNTNLAGSSDGDGIYEKTRNLYSKKKLHIVAIIRMK